MTRSLAALTLLLAIVLTACGAGRDALVVYSGRSQELVGPVLEDFHAETQIPIDVRYGGSAELALLLSEEAEGGNVAADVFISQSPGAVGFLAEEGLLEPLPAELLNQVDPRFRSDEGRWVGLTARQRVLVYNRELVDEADLPTSVTELTDPRYAGRVGVAPQNGSFQDFVSAMREISGDAATMAWLEGMAANDSPTYANNNAIVEAVSRGEIPLGLVNHYYNERFLAEDPSLPSRNHLFAGDDPGSLLIPSTASVLTGTDKAQQAQRLLEFLLAPPAQEYFAHQTFEYPLAGGVQPAVDLPSLAELDTPGVDIDALGGDLQRTVEMIRESGLPL